MSWCIRYEYAIAVRVWVVYMCLLYAFVCEDSAVAELRYLQPICATLLEIALALRHLHSPSLVHGDLNPLNVLLK